MRNCGNDERKEHGRKKFLIKNVNTVEVDGAEIDGEIKDIEDNTQVEHAYGADDIQILEGLEAVRKKTGYVYRLYR